VNNRRGFLGLTALGVVGAAARPARARPVFDVTDFGARGDGTTLATAALQKAIDRCAATGGGTVVLPPGRYLSGALFLRSHVHLDLTAGAVLAASRRFADFPPVDARDEGIERKVHASLLTGFDLVDVAITGRGTLDGQGEPWWQAYEATWKMRLDANLPREADNPPAAPLKWPRPRLVNLVRCKEVLIDGVFFSDTPFYAVHLVYCEDALIRGVTCSHQSDHNTTALVVDSCRRVQITDCLIAHGGEGIGIKSGYNEDGRRVNRPSEDVVITGCHLYHLGSAAVAVGSEVAGGIRNLVVSDCLIHEARNGIHIRAPRGRGGIVEQVRVSNVVLDQVEVALKVSHFFDSVRMDVIKGSARRNMETARSRKAPVDEGTPSFRDFVFSGVTVGKTGDLVVVEGLPERYISGLVFENIEATSADSGIYCTLASQVTISNVRVGTLQAPAVDARDVERLEVHRLRASHPCADAPAIWLENVAGAFLHGCDIGSAGPRYRWLREEQSKGVTLAANRVPPLPPGAE
jgi:polygalacturonase